MTLLHNALIAAVAAFVAGSVAPAFAKAADSDAAPPTVLHDACSWNRPGVDPFMGDVVAAVDRYRDIPADVRARLKTRMAKRQYDDLVSIRRDSIDGRAGTILRTRIARLRFTGDAFEAEGAATLPRAFEPASAGGAVSASRPTASPITHTRYDLLLSNGETPTTFPPECRRGWKTTQDQ